MKIKSSWGIPATLLSVLFWGISFVSTKIILNDLPPVSIAFFRQFIALIPLIILMYRQKESYALKKGEIFQFIVATLFGIVLYFYFENRGLTMTTASNASMLVAAIPILTLIVESITLRKPLKLSILACILTSVLGVYFVIFETGAPDFSSKTFLGNLLVIGAMLSWILYTFLSKHLGARYSSLKMTTLQTLFSIPLFIPFVLGEIKAWKIPSLLSLGNLIFLGIFCSTFAYVLFLFGLKALGPVLPSALLNLIPVVTVLVGTIFLDEKMTLPQILGAILIVGSLTFLSIIRSREERTVPKSEA